MSEQWWRIGGSNLQAQYGWGTEDEAEEFCRRLNQDRDNNLYAHEEYPDYDEASRDDGIDLQEELAL